MSLNQSKTVKENMSFQNTTQLFKEIMANCNNKSRGVLFRCSPKEIKLSTTAETETFHCIFYLVSQVYPLFQC